jgi:hypothetical protein
MASMYTQADLTAVKAAIIALATGQRVARVVYAGPPQREVDYVATDLPQLRSLQTEIQRDLQGTPTYSRVSFNKGFDPNNSGSGVAG